MKIKLVRLTMENFKGCKCNTINFGDKTSISGANASGKTTIMDAFMWLLFDKDSSGSAKFQIRPLDESGETVDNVEIMVEGALDLDGTEVILKKVQKQKWVKKRGNDTAELQGNENLFEINGYPKSEKEYKESISKMVEEELFKLITNPQAFAFLPWKKQRETLIKIVHEFSDVEFANKEQRFLPLISELEQASTEDIQKKYTKALNEWKKKQEEIPARIDELSKQLIDTDVAELELQRNALQEQIKEAEELIENSEKSFKDFEEKSNGVLELKFKLNDMEKTANEELISKKRDIQKQLDEVENEFQKAYRLSRNCEEKIADLKSMVNENEAKINQKKAEYKEVFSEKFDENAKICPACRQDLPECKISELIDNYEAERAKRLEQIARQGNALKAAIIKDKEEIQELEQKFKESKEALIRFNGKKTKAMEELASLPAKVDLSENQEFESLQLQLQKMEETMHQMNSGADYRRQLKIKAAGMREELSMAEKKIAGADNSKIESRMEELQAEQKEVSQKVADQEKLLNLLQEFIQAKMNGISATINSGFQMVSWKLFERQLNGGIKETCECTFNGIPYNSLNNGHRVLAGLDIIRTISSLYEVQAPIFIDNAEALNDYNIPQMECQMILLKVSEDSDLKIEQREDGGN